MTVLMPEDFKPNVLIISQNDFNVQIYQLLNDLFRNVDTEIKAMMEKWKAATAPPQAYTILMEVVKGWIIRRKKKHDNLKGTSTHKGTQPRTTSTPNNVPAFPQITHPTTNTKTLNTPQCGAVREFALVRNLRVTDDHEFRVTERKNFELPSESGESRVFPRHVDAQW
jgi:hypothetical protein